jgi:hypothetical protein
MNIFYLDEDVEKAARGHLDKHVVKMPLETAQILCTACHLNGVKDVPYKETHKKHPCVKWAAESKENIEWLWTFGMALCEEYTHRYEKTHACEGKVFEWFSKKEPLTAFPKKRKTKHPMAMPEQYKSSDPVDSYRRYYREEKRRIAEWTKRDPPEWWT